MMQMNGLLKDRIIVTGSNGMLGQRTVEFYSSNENVELPLIYLATPYLERRKQAKEALEKAIMAYANRNRRFGTI